MRTLYLAAGCFWGTEAFFAQMKGVISTTCGYANGNIDHPFYEDLKSGRATHAEAVKVVFDEMILGLDKLLSYYLSIIDPYAFNHQGEDYGLQYRTGVYWEEKKLEPDILTFFHNKEKEMGNQPFAIELMKLKNFFPAEEYHQNYLRKHPGGYCHIHLGAIRKEDRK